MSGFTIKIPGMGRANIDFNKGILTATGSTENGRVHAVGLSADGVAHASESKEVHQLRKGCNEIWNAIKEIFQDIAKWIKKQVSKIKRSFKKLGREHATTTRKANRQRSRMGTAPKSKASDQIRRGETAGYLRAAKALRQRM